MILDDPTHGLIMEIIRAFTTMIPQVKARFRDNCILPKLLSLAEKNADNTIITQKAEV